MNGVRSVIDSIDKIPVIGICGHRAALQCLIVVELLHLGWIVIFDVRLIDGLDLGHTPVIQNFTLFVDPVVVSRLLLWVGGPHYRSTLGPILFAGRNYDSRSVATVCAIFNSRRPKSILRAIRKP